jgi:hypothetical protein
MATDNIETLLPQGQLRPDKKEKGSFVLSKYFFVAPACGIDTTASLRMFLSLITKYKTYITMSKSSTISLDVLNAFHKKGMLNASS